ncbi:hypothetical protein CDAR_77801 [Caerostris darwini]|uniref:Uncharacterized protein n=1 Tax=Caerostris darwini TaxID=1538125 RepID=A0AAV4NG47_9ARAC|nr:hypothetical protein CDAR_77801 [Caerostris darwini]
MLFPRSCVWRRPTDSLGTHQGFKGASETDSLSFSHLEPLLREKASGYHIFSPGIGRVLSAAADWDFGMLTDTGTGLKRLMGGFDSIRKRISVFRQKYIDIMRFCLSLFTLSHE